MIIKGLIEEDLINYKLPSMFIIFTNCSFKCDKECGEQVCQNSTLAHTKNINIATEKIVKKYCNNPITKTIVCGGLEPLDDFNDLYNLIATFRIYTNDDIIIYTGYNKNEILNEIEKLKEFENIIIKFGRFIPNQEKHYDKILGVELASPNQYAERIS